MATDYLLKPEVEEANKRKSRIITALLTLLIIIGAIFIGLYGPYPPPPEEGIFVNFGTTDYGSGTVEPQKQEVIEEQQAQPEASSVEQVENIESSNDVNATEVNTQQEQNKPTETNETTKPVEQSKPEPVPDPEPVVDQNKLFTGNSNNSNSNSQGNDPADRLGNKGQQDGSNGPNYQGNNTGLGNQGSGFDIEGRGLVYKPTNYYSGAEQGIVRLKIIVDANGKVISAEYFAKNSTITDHSLIALAKKTAMKLKYSPDSKSPRQSALISVKFGM